MQPVEGFETTTVKKATDKVYFIHDGSQGYVIPRDEVKKELGKDLQQGDTLKVFLYRDREGAVTATVKEPLALVGDFASLKVHRSIPAGLFLDRGLPYDLFAPTGQIRGGYESGDYAVVRLIPDKKGFGVVATTDFGPYFDRDVSPLEEGQQVSLLAFSHSPLGYGVVIDNRWEGLLYRSELFQEVNRGDHLTGYIKKIREDGRIDVSLQPQDFQSAAEDAKRRILREVEKSEDGFLPLGDKTPPRQIMERLSLSKKRFKAAAGMLQKEGKIKISPDGLRLIKENR